MRFKIFIFPKKYRSNNHHTIYMSKKVVKMSKLQLIEQNISFKWAKNSSDEQKNYFQMNQKDSSNEQLFFGDLLNQIFLFI